MKYVMSDIHGNFDKYMEMLSLIEFTGNDELYILGDIFDRGNDSLGILEHIMKNKNIHLIKGNHEQMYIECYEDEFRDTYSWFCNGGLSTFNQMVSKGHFYMDNIYRNELILNNKMSIFCNKIKYFQIKMKKMSTFFIFMLIYLLLKRWNYVHFITSGCWIWLCFHNNRQIVQKTRNEFAF